MEKRLKQAKQEEREKTRASKLEIKYGNKHLKRLAEECGYEFVYRAWLEAQSDMAGEQTTALVFLIIGLAASILYLFGIGNPSYLIFYIAAYYFLGACRIDRLKVEQHFDKIINASRAHNIQGEIEAFIHLNEEIENENAKS